jgi:hypothetical protein
MVAAHSVSAVLSTARAETGKESAERVSAGAGGHLTVVVGFAVVAAVVGLCCRLFLRRRRGPSAALFVVLPPAGFLATELAERIVHAESFPFQPALEPRLLIGLALQLPFGLAAFVVARLLLRAVERVVVRLARRSRRRPVRTASAKPAPTVVLLPRITGVALGYPQRGPPSLQ